MPQRLDPASGKPVAQVKLGGPVPTAMDQGFGSLWLAVDSRPAKLVRVDLAKGRIAATITLPAEATIQEEGSVAAGEGAVWVVVNQPERTLLKVDPQRNRVVAAIEVPSGVAGARAGLGGVWLTDPIKDDLIRLDPASGTVVATVKTGLAPRFLALGEGAVWVQNNADGTVSRVDPATNAVVATIPVDVGPVDGGGIAVGGGSVWARVSGSLVTRIDPATNTVTARLGEARGSGSVAADSTAVWISAHDVNAVYRVPLTP